VGALRGGGEAKALASNHALGGGPLVKSGSRPIWLAVRRRRHVLCALRHGPSFRFASLSITSTPPGLRRNKRAGSRSLCELRRARAPFSWLPFHRRRPTKTSRVMSTKRTAERATFGSCRSAVPPTSRSSFRHSMRPKSARSGTARASSSFDNGSGLSAGSARSVRSSHSQSAEMMTACTVSGVTFPYAMRPTMLTGSKRSP
jgi:hypothetical protein